MKEDEHTELKKSTSELKEAILSISAILNKHQKGEIYFGIRNDGVVVGQDVSDKTLRDISTAISNHIEPKIYPHVKEVEFGGKKCIHVSFEGHEVPYFAYGKAYIRVGTENKLMSAQELKNYILKRNKSLWEEQLSDKTVDNINVNELKEYIARANEAKRIDFRFTNVRATLQKLGLIKDGKLLKATELLFCNQNSLEVQAAIFASKEKLTFLDIQQFKGTLFSVLRDSENYIKEHMNWRADLSGSSRIEIYNPGDFPEGVRIEDYLQGEERSILRNPTVANTLFLSKDIERWGSGLKRIYDECKQNKVKVEFKILKTGFLVVFYRREDVTEEKVTEKVTEKATEKADQ